MDFPIMWFMLICITLGLCVWFAPSYPRFVAAVALSVLTVLYEEFKRPSEGDTAKPPDDPDQLGYFRRPSRDDQ